MTGDAAVTLKVADSNPSYGVHSMCVAPHHSNDTVQQEASCQATDIHG